MKISNGLLNELTMIAQQVLAPDQIGSDVQVHLTTGLVHDTLRAVIEAICPCVVGEPCSSNCTCVDSFMSGGCSNCSRYGSPEQRRLQELRLEERRKFAEWMETVDRLRV